MKARMRSERHPVAHFADLVDAERGALVRWGLRLELEATALCKSGEPLLVRHSLEAVIVVHVHPEAPRCPHDLTAQEKCGRDAVPPKHRQELVVTATTVVDGYDDRAPREI